MTAEHYALDDGWEPKERKERTPKMMCEQCGAGTCQYSHFTQNARRITRSTCLVPKE